MDGFYLQGSCLLTIKLGGLGKDDPTHRKVQSHADGIRGYHHLGLMGRKKMDLPSADLRGKAAVDHAGLHTAVLETPCDVQHRTLGKCDDGIALLHIIREDKGHILA